MQKAEIGECRLVHNRHGRGDGRPYLVFVYNKTQIGFVQPGGGFGEQSFKLDQNGVADLHAYLRADPGCKHEPAPLLPGEYHPRICRGTNWPPDQVDDQYLPHFNQRVSLELSVAPLDGLLREILEVIEPIAPNLDAHGHRIRHLLILACTEVEASLQGILRDNGNSPSGRNWSTNDYVKLLRPMRLNEWRVRLGLYLDSPELSPFSTWTVAQPTQSLPWYDAYNKTKHDRESNLKLATLDHALQAMAALFILAKAQFGHNALDNWSLARFGIIAEPQWDADELYFRFYPGLKPKNLVV